MDSTGFIRSMFTLDVDSGMSDRDRITLSPIEKWREYRRFPFKLVIHSMLLALVTILIFIVVTQFTTYARSNEMIFAKYFLEMEDGSETMMIQICSVDEWLERLNHIVETYYNLDDQTFSKFILDVNRITGEPDPIQLQIQWRPNVTIDNSMLITENYVLTDDDPLGPFNITKAAMKKFLAKTSVVDFNFWLSSTVPTQFFSAPFRWFITLHFTNIGGIFQGQVRSSRHIENQVLLYKLGWIPILAIIVASLSLVLGIKAIFASCQIFFRTKAAFSAIPKETLAKSYEALQLPGLIPIMEWKDVPYGVKLDFFGSWYGLEILGEVSLLVACFHGLIHDLGMPISDMSRVFLGSGFLIICVGFAKYLEYWKKFYMLIITMQGSFQRNLRFVISVLPLYMGFCACGFIIFSPYTEDFSSLDKSAITLFALLNGDDIHASFQRIYSRYPYPIVGQVFLFTFIIMFITLVLNIFLFIIEDAYHAAKDYINTKAERHSRIHRRKTDRDAAAWMPPRLGDIEFDLPTLFDVIEESIEHIPAQKKKNIRKRSKSRRPLLSPNIANPSINDELPLGAFSLSEFGSYLTPTRALGTALSSTFGGVASSWGGREVPIGGLRGKLGPSTSGSNLLGPTSGLNTNVLGSNPGLNTNPTSILKNSSDNVPSSSSTGDQGQTEMLSSTPSASPVSPATARSQRKVSQRLQFAVSTDPSSSSQLHAAISNTIASSQAEFLLEVDEKMKTMRERFAHKLQQDLEVLLSGLPKPSVASNQPEQPPQSSTPSPSTLFDADDSNSNPSPVLPRRPNDSIKKKSDLIEQIKKSN